MAFFKKFIVAIVTGFIFSVTISLLEFTPLTERSENVLYHSLPSLLAMSILYIVPIFIFLGTPISMVIDRFLFNLKTESKARNYVLSVLFYTVGGIIVVMLFLTFIQRGRIHGLSVLSEILSLVVIASLLFLHISILLDVILKKLKRYLINGREA